MSKKQRVCTVEPRNERKTAGLRAKKGWIEAELALEIADEGIKVWILRFDGEMERKYGILVPIVHVWGDNAIIRMIDKRTLLVACYTFVKYQNIDIQASSQR